MSNIIQSLWIGNSLSKVEQLSLSSFIKNGHPVHLYSYHSNLDVPLGVEIKNANDILPQSQIFTYNTGSGKGSYSGFSNFFRYKLSSLKGGWWVDTDVVCLKPFDFPEDYVFASEETLVKGKSQISSCIFKASRSSEIMTEAYNICSKKNVSKIGWGETGPFLIEKLIKKHNLLDNVQDTTVFNPISYSNLNYFFDHRNVESSISNSYSVHLWNEMWRRKKIDKNKTFRNDSLIEYLKKEYLHS